MADPVTQPSPRPTGPPSAAVPGAAATGARNADAAVPDAGRDGGTRAATAELAADLRALRISCGNPSYAALRRGSALLPPATISDALRGRVVPRLEFVVAYVQGCLRYATDRGMEVDPALADLRIWRRRWLEVRRQADGERAGAAAGSVRSGRGGGVESSEGGDGVPGGALREGAAPPWQLPTPVRRLEGRTAELAWLDAVHGAVPAGTDGGAPTGSDRAGDARRSTDGVRDDPVGAARVAVLSGMGGVGKTALALSWGHRRRGLFPDGQLFVDLGGFGPGGPADPAQVLATFVRALGVAPSAVPGDIDALSALFRSLCQGRKVLVVLDNAASATQVLPLLPASAEAMTIVTSRDLCNGLSVRADAVRRIVHPLAADEAVTMLTRDLPRLDRDRLGRLAAVCGHLPLALRLAASKLSDDPADVELAALIDRSAAGVTTTGDLLSVLADPADPYCDLTSVLAWSMAGGSAAESRAIGLLGQSPGGPVDDHLAAALIGLAVTPTRQILSSLAARHLVQRTARGWQLHDVVHAWARRMGQDELGARQCREAQRRVVGYYLWTADAMDRLLLPQRDRPTLESALPRPLDDRRWADAADALAWGDAALDALPDVIALALELDEYDCAAMIPHILMSYLNLRKPWAQWIAVCRAAMAGRGHVSSPEVIGNLHLCIGIALRETGALPEAIAEFSEALRAYRQAGNAVGAAMTLNNLATCHQQCGRPDRAREDLRASADELTGGGDDYRRAIVLHNLAEVDVDLGDLSNALDHAEQALAAAVMADDTLGAATTRTTIARIHLLLGEPDLAEEELSAVLPVQRAGGDVYGVATTARHLGQLLLDSGRPDEAADPLAEAAQILSGIGDPAAEEVAALLARARGETAATGRRRRLLPGRRGAGR